MLTRQYLTFRDASFWALSPGTVASRLETDTERGLSAVDAFDRIKLFGKNIIDPPKRASSLRILFNQFKSPLILILLAAGAITIAIAHYRDAVFILIAVAVNAGLGFLQENKAERALAELKTYLKQRARVIRDGKEHEVDAEEIVPGDIIRLAQGDRVPADARLIYLNDFQVDESILTGESLPVTKSTERVAVGSPLADQNSMIFAGTLVTQGVATGIVCRTAADTEFGKIATLLASSQEQRTPLQTAIATFSVQASAFLGALTVAVFAMGIAAGYSLLDMFLTAVAIAVSAIPEGLPVAMTVILAVGVERMAKRKGVVRKLVAAEALGSTTVILTDKTGTLTTAEMALSHIRPITKSESDIMSLALSNAQVLVENPDDPVDSWRMNGRIMEKALVKAAAERGVSIEKISDKSHVLQSMPFNAVQKFSVSLVEDAGHRHLIFFGAPDILLSHASLDSSQKKQLLSDIDAYASSGERVLGVATKPVGTDGAFAFPQDADITNCDFQGLISFRDPIRPGIAHTVQRVERAGIRTVLLTGDHRGTAIAVAHEVGIRVDENSVLDARQLENIGDDALLEQLEHITVIARVTPLDKLRIVQLLQRKGEVVAMTGDGVNDAPSIKEADVGIAMGSGTEVAQSVADLVLLDDNFETIVAAIEEGRQIIANIRKVLVYLLSNVTDGLILIGGALITGLPLPLNALQILWVNFFTDSFPAVAYAFEKEPDGLGHRPRDPKKGLFDPLMRFLVLAIGVSTSAFLFILYFVLMKLNFDEELVSTFIFAAFGTYTLLVALSVRSLEKSILSVPLFSNIYLTGGVLAGFVLMAAAVYMPFLQTLFGTVALSLPWIVGVILVGVLNIVLIESAKWFFRTYQMKSYTVSA